MIRLLTASLLGALLFAPSVSAQEDAVSDFLSCDPLVIPSERLACFDSVLKQYKLKYGLLKGDAQSMAQQNMQRPRAVPQGQVNAERLDRRQAENPNRSQFASKETRAIIRDISQSYTGRRTFILDDGSQWQETDGSIFPHDNLKNREGRVEKGLFGSWRLYVEGITGFARVKRISSN